MKVAFIVRELTYLKLLQPIINKAEEMGCNIILYNMDSPKGEKEYNRPTKARIDKSFGRDVKVSPFVNDGQLLQKIVQDKITKFVSLEMGLWASKYTNFFKTNNIKTYTVSYLTDSIWGGKSTIEGFDRVYYSSKYLMNMHHKFSNVSFNPKRDRCLGSPIFDQLDSIDNSKAEDVLILLPNQCEKKFFGGNGRFYKILEAFGPNLIFKSRKKQWIPEEIKKLAKEIVFDGDFMYPSAISTLYPRTKATVIFYSSGIYEAVCGNQYVINVRFPLSLWPRDQKKMQEYFSNEVYNYNGVVENVEQSDVLDGKVQIKRVDKIRREEWVRKYIGKFKDKSYNLIAEDLING